MSFLVAAVALFAGAYGVSYAPPTETDPRVSVRDQLPAELPPVLLETLSFSGEGSSLPPAGPVAARSLPAGAERPPLAGTVSGRVIDAETGAPVSAARVLLPALGLGALSGVDGRFVLADVPDGTHELRAERIGYQPASLTVAVTSGATVAVEISLLTSVFALDEVVITGTPGGTQRRAIGNVVSTVRADEITARSPVGDVGQLLGQRTPGLMMLPGTGQVGTGSSIRIRGVGSITQGSDPIIYIDGIRMDSDAGRGPGQRGGANISRLNDINPNDIESIEIIKGPAAATLYGTEASAGVIQIITKRGSTGAAQFDFSTRQGTNWLWNPEARAGYRYAADPERPGEAIAVNIYEQERTNGAGPIFGYGRLQGYNLGVRGGTDAIRYFASISRDDDTGVVDWNWNERTSLRATTEIPLTSRLTAVLGSSYIQTRTRLAQPSIDADPFSQLIWALPRNLDDGRRGFLTAPPEDWSKVESRADNDRAITNLELRFRPVSWSTHRLVTGLDFNSEVNSLLIPRFPEGANHWYGQNALGNRNVTRAQRRYLTVDYAGSATFDRGDYSFQPSIGFQFYRSESASINASGQEFPAIPITTVGGGAVRNGGEAFSENSQVGVYFQQQVGRLNRLFLTGAVRADANSAFGSEFDAAIYPKLSGTWVISEEPFWNWGWVDQLRLRGAWGAAGRQPGAFDASRLYGAAVGYQDRPGLLPSAYGNPQLKPERGEELELGFDVTFLDGRLGLEYTRFDKRVKDAIVNRPVSPSTGFAGNQVVNLGRLEVWGNEIGVNAAVLRGDRFGWDVDFQFSNYENRILDIGSDDPIFGGTQSQHRRGYSIADIFMRRVLEAEIDQNGTVISAICDGGTGPQGVDPNGPPVPCSQAPQVWMGHSQPTWQVGVGSGVTLFHNLRLYARVEGNGGHHQVNTEIRATHNQLTTEGTVLRNNPLLQAYRSLEIDRTGLYEAGFLRLREVSATLDLPAGLATRVGARNASLSAGVRNVAMLWTAAHGWSTYRDGRVLEPIANMIIWDPEVRSTGNNSVGYQTILPPTANATVTLRLSF